MIQGYFRTNVHWSICLQPPATATHRILIELPNPPGPGDIPLRNYIELGMPARCDIRTIRTQLRDNNGSLVRDMGEIGYSPAQRTYILPLNQPEIMERRATSIEIGIVDLAAMGNTDWGGWTAGPLFFMFDYVPALYHSSFTLEIKLPRISRYRLARWIVQLFARLSEQGLYRVHPVYIRNTVLDPSSVDTTQGVIVYNLGDLFPPSPFAFLVDVRNLPTLQRILYVILGFLLSMIAQPAFENLILPWLKDFFKKISP